MPGNQFIDNMATLNLLLTDREKCSPFLKLFCFDLDVNISYLTALDLGRLFLVMNWPIQFCPKGTLAGLAWEELVNRAIQKNLPIYE